MPSLDEWETLAIYLGGNDLAYPKLRENGTSHWDSPNTGATNESGFTALPAGIRYDVNGVYIEKGKTTGFWSSEQNNTLNAYIRLIKMGGINYTNTTIWPKQSGFSVRCIKDKPGNK